MQKIILILCVCIFYQIFVKFILLRTDEGVKKYYIFYYRMNKYQQAIFNL